MNIKPIFFLLFIFALACGDSDTGSNNGTGDNNGAGGNNGSGDGDSEAVPAILCQARCVTKFQDCEIEPEPASIFCREKICNLSPNNGELKCIEAKSCDDIKAIESAPAGDFCSLDLG